MPDRWMEERERRWRERNWRSEAYGRGGEDRQGRLGGEDRSWGGSADEGRGPEGARFREPGRDRVFGEADTGAQYNIRTPRPGGGAYGAGGAYGGGEGYGPDTDRFEARRGYGEDRGGRGQPRFSPQDYTQGGRFYGDDRRMPIYREEYAQGRRDYGPAPRGYDAGRGGAPSGGTGGYDYERGYGDGGRMESGAWSGGGEGERGRGGWQDRDYQGESPAMYRGGGYEADRERGGWGDRYRDRDRYEDRDRDGPGFEGHARSAGEFLHRAGQRLSSWFGEMAGERRDDGDRDRGPRRYSADFGREERWVVDRGHRGRGPKNYDRPDERISDEAHDRLTDDRWLDASNISVSVSGGEITLSGTVESREAKHRAERLVEDISGVKHVQNNLRVDRGNVLTGSGSGFGDSVAEAKMRTDGGPEAGDGSAATRSTTRRS